jgi:hypothetical protein
MAIGCSSLWFERIDSEDIEFRWESSFGRFTVAVAGAGGDIYVCSQALHPSPLLPSAASVDGVQQLAGFDFWPEFQSAFIVLSLIGI